MNSENHNRGWLSKLPAASWIAEYSPQWLLSDLQGGVTLAAYAVPVSMAYATLAGLPPEHGIYCYLLGGLGYALLGSSRQLAIGPTSAIAMLVGATIGEMPGADAAQYVQIASLAALLVAVISGLAWLLKVSGLVAFVSDTILLGFKAGAALTIASTQLPKLFGVAGGGERFLERLWILGGQLPATNIAVLTLGLSAIVVLLLGDKLFPRLPNALIVVALATLGMSITPLGEWDIRTVGVIPAGLPELQLPALRMRDVDGVLPLSLACFLLAYIEGVSAAKTLAARHQRDIEPRQELLALGAANLAAAMGQGFPIAGGLSQSAVNDKAGAQTPLALVIASAALAACLLVLTTMLGNLPEVILAAIVLVAVKGLVDVSGLQALWRVHRKEFGIALLALVGVLTFGILKGVLLAAIGSLLALLAGVAQPHVAFLGRIPGSRRFSDLERHPDNEHIPQVIIFRPEASVLYFNADHVHRCVLDRVQSTPQVGLVVCDLSSSPMVDIAGAKMLCGLQSELASRGIALRIAESHGTVRDLLRAVGLEARVGYIGRHLSVDQALQDFAPASKVTLTPDDRSDCRA